MTRARDKLPGKITRYPSPPLSSESSSIICAKTSLELDENLDSFKAVTLAMHYELYDLADSKKRILHKRFNSLYLKSLNLHALMYLWDLL